MNKNLKQNFHRLFTTFIFRRFVFFGRQKSSVVKAKIFGNILQTEEKDSHFHAYWNFITPENSGKWGWVEKVQGEKDWTHLDEMHGYARYHHFLFKQHAFIWGKDGKNQPDWLAALPPDQQKAAVTSWIKEYGDRYPDTDYIDVVNEPLHVPPSYKDALGGDGETGWDWVIWSYETARRHNPKSKLILNEYFPRANWEDLHNFSIIVNLLKERNLIDEIGIQAHDFETINPIFLRFALEHFGSLGLPIHISELEMNVADDAAQLKFCQFLFTMFGEIPNIKAVTFWGYKEGKVWKENAHLLRADGTERPAFIWLKKLMTALTNKREADAEVNAALADVAA